jgi:hypothetical protein
VQIRKKKKKKIEKNILYIFLTKEKYQKRHKIKFYQKNKEKPHKENQIKKKKQLKC